MYDVAPLTLSPLLARVSALRGRSAIGPVFALKQKITLALRASNPKNLLARPKTYWPDIENMI